MSDNKIMLPIGWCGFHGGEPYPVSVHDTYGPAVGFDVFATRREARARYNDVRRVYVEIPVKSKP